MPPFSNLAPAPQRAVGLDGGFAPKSLLGFLNNQRSAWAIALCLAPLFLLILLPTAFNGNEYHYFMLAFRRVSPESFSAFSAPFDASEGRIFWELIVGNLIDWLGYDGAHTVLRLGMAVAYAGAVGYLFSTLRLSALDSLLTLGIFLILGQSILGREWLFEGVESKTVAYALIFLGLAFVVQGRPTYAIFAAVMATYFHFLVGGFWLLAFVAYDAMRDFAPKRQLRLVAMYFLLVAPLVLIIAYEQFWALHAAPRHPSASIIYAIRNAHHVAPFSSERQFHSWAPGIVWLLVLSLSFLLLSRSAAVKSRTFLYWVTGLLCYLVLALGLTALDTRTAYLAKFHLFRPASLTLLCAIVIAVGMFNEWQDKSGLKKWLRGFLFFSVMAIVTIGVVIGKARDLSAANRSISDDIARMNAFIVRTTSPQDIVLVQPGGEFFFPKVALPMLISRPTLVSLKFVPTNQHDIYRWYDLLLYRKHVFEDRCKDIGKYPVRYLLMMQRPDAKIPCGRVVWRSKYFMLVEP